MFDLDGTLFETARGIQKAVNQLMVERHEPELSYELVTSFIGFGLHKLIEQLDLATQHRLGSRERLEADFRRIYSSMLVEESQLYPGVVEFLSKRSEHLSVVSNKDELYVREMIARSPLRQFRWSHLIGGNTFLKKKPHPEPLFESMRSAGALPHEALMIGDGLPDIQGAKNAGVRSVAVTFGYTPISELIQAGADSQIASYNDLPNVIKNFC